MMNMIFSLKPQYLWRQSILLLIAVCWGLSLAQAADIRVSVDRNPVSMGESFQIIFSATESPDDDPDFSPLDENFSRLGQSQTENASWINGKASKAIKWLVSVMPKNRVIWKFPPSILVMTAAHPCR